jgi:hypothetical protein
VLGAASLFVYVWLLPNLAGLSSTTWMPMPSGLDVPDWLRVDGPPPTLDEGEKGQRHAATAVYVAIGFTALYLLYFSSARLARGGASLLGLAIVAAGAVTFQAFAVMAPYSLSSDVFSYAIYGRIFAVYGGSPYLEAPIRYSSDAFYPFVYWMHVPSFYGPLWTLISGWVALAADGEIGTAILLFRLIQAGSALGAGVAVFLLLRHVDPERALVGTLLVTWCPLVVVESGLSAHNDVLMGFLIVVGMVLAWTGRPILGIWSVGAVVLAGLIKVTALALLPLLGIYLLRSASTWGSRIVIAFGSGVVAVSLTAIVVVPVWSGPETFAVQTLGSGQTATSTVWPRSRSASFDANSGQPGTTSRCPSSSAAGGSGPTPRPRSTPPVPARRCSRRCRPGAAYSSSDRSATSGYGCSIPCRDRSATFRPSRSGRSTPRLTCWPIPRSRRVVTVPSARRT